MVTGNIAIVRAGAGSGKTYKIQQELGELIERGTIRPERVMAVTFTEAAAMELRERITQRLTELHRIEDALRLSQAYITTIHGFGLRVLTEFAFEDGSTPSPRLLNEYEEAVFVRKSLENVEGIAAVVNQLEALGYKWDWVNQHSEEDLLRKQLLRVLQLLRSIGVTDTDRLKQVSEAAMGELSAMYGKVVDPEPIRQHLHEQVGGLLRVYPDSWVAKFDENALGKDPRKQFSRDYRYLRDAWDTDGLSSSWALWQGLRKLRTISAKKLPLPGAYLNLAKDVMHAADAIIDHPGPRDQAKAHVQWLLSAGFAVEQAYAQAKRDAGVVDYTDMLAAAERLIHTREDVRRTLKERIDYMVVDEFQDTSPLQFALLWRLYEAGVPMLVVGDLKQAIMGFQGADPRLFKALAYRYPSATSALPCNWRSQPKLMSFINAIGPVLFDNDYQRLQPKAPSSDLGPLEFVAFATRSKKDMHKVRATAVGGRLRQLLEEEVKVVDRTTKRSREIRGSDIAVLCPTHKMLHEYAQVLRADLGLSVNLQADGWLGSRSVQIGLSALQYVYNPGDRHAALYLATTELGSLSLEAALSQLLGDAVEGKGADPVIDEPLLHSLLKFRENGATQLTVYALLVELIDALELFDRIAKWQDSEQHRANLIHLLGLAEQFTDTDPAILVTEGYFGGGVPTFLAWLERRQEEDDAQPERKVFGTGRYRATHMAQCQRPGMAGRRGGRNAAFVSSAATTPCPALRFVRRLVANCGEGRHPIPSQVCGAGEERGVPESTVEAD